MTVIKILSLVSLVWKQIYQWKLIQPDTLSMTFNPKPKLENHPSINRCPLLESIGYITYVACIWCKLLTWCEELGLCKNVSGRMLPGTFDMPLLHCHFLQSVPLKVENKTLFSKNCWGTYSYLQSMHANINSLAMCFSVVSIELPATYIYLLTVQNW